jgi:FMN phosphatase YigB (HAD superfamily)
VQPDGAGFLDDSEACVAGARCVGINGVLFVDNDQAIAELNSYLVE